VYVAESENGTHALTTVEYHSGLPKVELNLVIPAIGLDGRCAVLPTGICMNPVLLTVKLPGMVTD
jgi:hypothetical protein